jgi:hypothetical protein
VADSCTHFYVPPLCCGLDRVPRTTQRRRVAQVQVTNFVYLQACIYRRSKYIDPLSYLRLPMPHNLCAQQSSGAPDSRYANMHFVRTRIVGFVVPNSHFGRKRIETGFSRFRFSQAGASNRKVKYLEIQWHDGHTHVMSGNVQIGNGYRRKSVPVGLRSVSGVEWLKVFEQELAPAILN